MPNPAPISYCLPLADLPWFGTAGTMADYAFITVPSGGPTVRLQRITFSCTISGTAHASTQLHLVMRNIPSSGTPVVISGHPLDNSIQVPPTVTCGYYPSGATPVDTENHHVWHQVYPLVATGASVGNFQQAPCIVYDFSENKYLTPPTLYPNNGAQTISLMVENFPSQTMTPLVELFWTEQ